MKKPNVLFLFSDQHSAKILGHKGHPHVKTPNLDRLACEGVSFDNAVTQNPICTPSRVSFLSGQYCHNHQYYGLGGENPNGLPNLFGHFKNHGYKTAAIGKIHCPNDFITNDCDYLNDIYESGKYRDYLKKLGIDKIEDSGHLTEFEYEGYQPVDARVSSIEYRNSTEGYIVSEAIDFMEKAHKDEEPFFVFTSMQRPHECYTPSEPFWSMYDDVNMSLPISMNQEAKDKAPHLKKTAEEFKNGFWIKFEPKTYNEAAMRKYKGYLGCVSQVDFAVGELLSYLDEKDIADDTIVIYSSDHGEYVCEHNIMEKAPGICSDMVTRIPLLFRYKSKVNAGVSPIQLAEAVDVSATLCSLCGIEGMETSDGKDLSDILMGGTHEMHEIAVTENLWSKSMRKGEYRFVYYPQKMFEKEYPDGFGELYDLGNDPYELDNLYFDNKYTSLINEFRTELFDWLVTTTRPKSIVCSDKIQSDRKISISDIEQINKMGNKNYL